MQSNRSTAVDGQSIEHIQQCLTAISLALSAEQYAVIGGAALIALGALHRATEDVDLLVNRGSTIRIKNLLAQHPDFHMDPRTRHLHYSSSHSETHIPIDVLTSALAFIPEEEIALAMGTASGLRIARTTSLLNFKISSSY